jgi:hypothetical protein
MEGVPEGFMTEPENVSLGLAVELPLAGEATLTESVFAGVVWVPVVISAFTAP